MRASTKVATYNVIVFYQVSAYIFAAAVNFFKSKMCARLFIIGNKLNLSMSYNSLVKIFTIVHNSIKFFI